MKKGAAKKKKPSKVSKSGVKPISMSSKKSKNPKFKWALPIFFIFVLTMLAASLIVSNSGLSGNVINGNAADSGSTTVVNNYYGTGAGSASSFLDMGPSNSVLANIANALNLGTTWREIIIGLVVIAIVFAGVYDLLELVSIFDVPWVKIVISVGIGIVAALVGVTQTVAKFAIKFAAGAGAVGIGIEIVVSVVIFIGLSFGNHYLAKFAAKRKGQKEEIKAITGASQTVGAITGLRAIQKAFKKNP